MKMAKTDEILSVQRLATEYEHNVMEPRLVDRFEGRIIELSEIEPANLGPERRLKWHHFHLRSLVASMCCQSRGHGRWGRTQSNKMSQSG